MTSITHLHHDVEDASRCLYQRACVCAYVYVYVYVYVCIWCLYCLSVLVRLPFTGTPLMGPIPALPG